MESRPPQKLPSTNYNPYPDRLRGVFSTPPMDNTDGVLPIEMVINSPPTRPPCVVDPDAQPLSMANLHANWFSDGHRVSLVYSADWQYPKVDVRRFAAPGVEDATDRFNEYTNCIGPLYSIPPNLMADHMFLLHPEHAAYVGLASQYFSGETLASPFTESNLYSIPIPRQDSRSPLSRAWTGTWAAIHARGIIMYV